MVSQPIEDPIQQMHSHVINLQESTLVITQNLSSTFSGLSKGYFLEGNIDRISSFNIWLNGHKFHHYNKIMLQLYSTKIHDNLLFLPFSASCKDYINRNRYTFVAGLNHGRIDSIVCEITFTTPQTYFAIHSVEFNILTYNTGQTKCKYNNDVQFINVFSTNNSRYMPPTLDDIIYTNPSPIEWNTENKIIDITRNDECPIMYSRFENGCIYATCETCNVNVDADALKTYFNTIFTKTCPCCRSQWTNFIVYVNTPYTNQRSI